MSIRANGRPRPHRPHRALDLYLSHKATDCAEKTVQNHRNRLARFVRWCDGEDVGNLNGLSGRNLHEYRLWRQDGGDPNALTVNAQVSTLRVFLKKCASIEAVAPELYDEVMVPRADPEDQQRDETLDAETAQAILTFLSAFHYASVEHALFAVLWEAGLRIGSWNSLDVGDVDLEDRSLEPVHRPDEGTALKNGKGGERPVAITPELASVLEDYVERQPRGSDRRVWARPAVHDESRLDAS